MSDTANLSKPIVLNPFGHLGLDFEKAAERYARSLPILPCSTTSTCPENITARFILKGKTCRLYVPINYGGLII
jgi:hypothetical protein